MGTFTTEQDLRREAIRRRMQGELRRDICGGLERSTSWFDKWWAEYRCDPHTDFADHSRAPHASPYQIVPAIEQAIVTVRRTLEAAKTPDTKYGLIGAPSMRGQLKRLGLAPLPSDSAIQRILAQHDLTHPIGAGNVMAQQLYLPYGAPRWGSGTLPTDFTFTGQRADSYIKLIQMGARWYDADLGRWVSPDSIVPQPGNPQTLNRYSYVNNRPLVLRDPGGHDPLGPDWEKAFRSAHGRAPTDADRQARLYSVIFPGSVSGQRDWTDEDWADFSTNRVALFTRDTTDRKSLSDFAAEIRRLSKTYSPGEQEQFVWAIALLYGGVPYGTKSEGLIEQLFGGPRVDVPECVGAPTQCAWLTHGMEGFNNQVARQGEENTHHYAGELLAGYYLGEAGTGAATRAREIGQGFRFDGRFPFVHVRPDSLDVNMGDIAARHGHALATGTVAPWDLPNLILQNLGQRSQ